MSKVKDKELAEKYDFSKGERGVHYNRAKNGIRTFPVSDAEDSARPSADPNARRPPSGDAAKHR